MSLNSRPAVLPDAPHWSSCFEEAVPLHLLQPASACLQPQEEEEEEEPVRLPSPISLLQPTPLQVNPGPPNLLSLHNGTCSG